MEGRVSVSISESEILDELRRAFAARGDSGDFPGAVTCGELIEAMGMYPLTIRTEIKRLLRAGVVECVKVRRPSIDGRNACVPAYRLVPKRADAA